MGDNDFRNVNSFEDPSHDDQPKVTDFDNFLPWACKQYSVEKKVVVIKSIQQMYVNAADKLRKKSSRIVKQSKVIRTLMQSEHGSINDHERNGKESSSATEASQENVFIVDTIYDNNRNLVQLKFLKNNIIPQVVMKIVGISIPYHKYLTSITINSGLNKENLHEIANFLPNSNITELCFDGAFVREANYYIVLTHEKLKHLSLAKCFIDDAGLKTITDQLVGPQIASKVLSALNLSSNRITDVGAKYVADMLRTNRQLSYLNLAGNLLTDEGGISILNTLQKFPLGTQEAFDARIRYVAFLKQNNDLDNTLQCTRKDKINDKKSNLKKDKLESPSQKCLSQKDKDTRDAEIIQEKHKNMMGYFDDHFSPDNTESKDGILHCLGNNTLCCLNLAYNNLTYYSVKKLHEVLQMQVSLNRNPKGLLRVIIEGNPMPVHCKEYYEINRFLGKRLVDIRKPHVATLKHMKSMISK